jgi:hypothetical protein
MERLRRSFEFMYSSMCAVGSWCQVTLLIPSQVRSFALQATYEENAVQMILIAVINS